MRTPLACSDYYETSVPPRTPRSAADLSRPGPAARHPGRPRMVPTFTSCSIGQAGTQLYPGSIATPTPQTFGVASAPLNTLGAGVGFPANGSRALHPGPYPPDSSRYYAYGASTTGSLSLYPLALLAGPAPSGSTGASRHRRSCFPPSPALPGSGCSQLQPSRCDSQAGKVFHLPSNIKRLVAHVLVVERAGAWGCARSRKAICCVDVYYFAWSRGRWLGTHNPIGRGVDPARPTSECSG